MTKWRDKKSTGVLKLLLIDFCHSLPNVSNRFRDFFSDFAYIETSNFQARQNLLLKSLILPSSKIHLITYWAKTSMIIKQSLIPTAMTKKYWRRNVWGCENSAAIFASKRTPHRKWQSKPWKNFGPIVVFRIAAWTIDSMTMTSASWDDYFWLR